MAEIKALETRYNGYRFRSRLEARWAVFFDEMGWSYEYEPEGFELDRGIKYLPDFYLPEFNMYVEVKHENAFEELEGGFRLKDKKDDEKVNLFSEDVLDYEDRQILFVTRGDPYNTLMLWGLVYVHGVCAKIIANAIHTNVTVNGCNQLCDDCKFSVCGVKTTGLIVPTSIFQNHKENLFCREDKKYVMCVVWDMKHHLRPFINGFAIKPDKLNIEDLENDNFRKYHASALKARQARFEHGECG